jgi:hypothetical protein
MKKIETAAARLVPDHTSGGIVTMSFALRTALSDEIAELRDALEQQVRETKHWKTNHNDVVKRLRVAATRPDLVSDRLPLFDNYRTVIKQQELNLKLAQQINSDQQVRLQSLEIALQGRDAEIAALREQCKSKARTSDLEYWVREIGETSWRKASYDEFCTAQKAAEMDTKTETLQQGAPLELSEALAKIHDLEEALDNLAPYTSDAEAANSAHKVIVPLGSFIEDKGLVERMLAILAVFEQANDAVGCTSIRHKISEHIVNIKRELRR